MHFECQAQFGEIAWAGQDPNDIMVFFGEIDRASSSFGGGRPALPVEVRP
jgi:hypothetical protein